MTGEDVQNSINYLTNQLIGHKVNKRPLIVPYENAEAIRDQMQLLLNDNIRLTEEKANEQEKQEGQEDVRSDEM